MPAMDEKHEASEREAHKHKSNADKGSAETGLRRGLAADDRKTRKPHVPKALHNSAAAVYKAAAGVADSASHAMSDFTKSDVGKTITRAGNKVIASAASAASAVGDKAVMLVDSTAQVVKESGVSAQVKRAREAAFRHGIKQGAYLEREERYNYYRAYVAALIYFLRCDGEPDVDDLQWLADSLQTLKLNGGLPDRVKEELQTIAGSESLTFDEVKDHLDKLSLTSLDSISEYVLLAIELDGVVTEQEARARQLYKDYVVQRKSYLVFEDDWMTRAVEASVREYGENVERIDREFKEKTKMQDKDIAFLLAATALQTMRVLIINSLTEVENAGQGNVKERALHGVQEKLFGSSPADGQGSSRLYASKEHILTARGVPYDATCYAEENQGLFKGANHRFATLGHDPLLGLVFGTANILTNTITCVRDAGPLGIKARIPVSYEVTYDALGKNPCIGGPAGSIEMLVAAARRIVEEPDAAAAALIKQLIHIGTDLYTPCGIQIPFANLVLDKKHVELLTEYISTGDLLKVGVQTGMAVLINWLVAALHGCSLIFNDDGTDYCTDLYHVRTRKILLASNAIAISSSVIRAAITGNPKCLDIGGTAVLVYRLFSDVRFTTRLKEEYINSELDKIYDERAAFAGFMGNGQ